MTAPIFLSQFVTMISVNHAMHRLANATIWDYIVNQLLGHVRPALPMTIVQGLNLSVMGQMSVKLALSTIAMIIYIVEGMALV